MEIKINGISTVINVIICSLLDTKEFSLVDCLVQGKLQMKRTFTNVERVMFAIS